jgi:CubicO group peptidase (beta-lactamase class C family)
MSPRKKLACMLLSFLLSATMLGGCNTGAQQPDVGMAGDGRLGEIVEYEREQAYVPGLTGMLIRDGEIIEQASRGLRAVNSDSKVSEQDLWHLGSLTKSMTATVAAVLVERGLIRWDSTVSDIFPELVGLMRDEYTTVRLEDLLSHTGGLTANLENVPHAEGYLNDTSPLPEQRLRFTAQVLQLPPEAERGHFLYSNAGYIVAGAMLEHVGGDSWEALMQNLLFTPLGMWDAGFGAPGGDGGSSIDQPRGHMLEGANWVAVNPNAALADNPAVIGPAGTVNASLSDVSRYLAAHLAGARGFDVPGLLTAASFAKLHTPLADNGYALGWMTLPGGTLWHEGSNDLWEAQFLINPTRNVALFTACNAADPESTDGGEPLVAINALADRLAEREIAAFGSE